MSQECSDEKDKELKDEPNRENGKDKKIKEENTITLLDLITASGPQSSDINDVFRAYHLSSAGLSSDEINQILLNIATCKKTFPFLQEAIQSNRYPHTIMTLAAKVGMYIPPRRRCGLETYYFYIDNVRYYEDIFERGQSNIPTMFDIYMSKDRVKLLMRLRDDEILRPGYRFSRNYSNRLEMITRFIADNISVHGEFRLENNSRKSYSTKAKVITYIEPNEKFSYSTSELARLFDVSRKIVWKSTDRIQDFNRYSLLHLRQQILEKFDQWRNRDGCSQFNGPSELYRMLTNLENILADEVRYDTSAYLGTPQLLTLM